MIPIEFADYESESWRDLYIAEYGILPELPPQTDVVPVIPWYALQPASDTDNKGKIDKKRTKGCSNKDQEINSFDSFAICLNKHIMNKQ